MMNNPIQEQTNMIHKLLENAINEATSAGELNKTPLLPFVVEIPADTSHGDFASNCAMVHAKAFKMAPRKIAEIVIKYLNTDGANIEKVEIAGPGFLNFFLKENWFAEVVDSVLEGKTEYGKSDKGNGKKVMVEFVSANPTGPMHVGNARGGAMGNSLANVLSWSGYEVSREFYVNDAGNQIEKFATSLDVRYQQLFKGEAAVPLPEDAYQGKDIIENAKDFAAIYQDKYLEKSEKERKDALVSFALPKNLEQIKKDLESYRIKYDTWFHESDLYKEGYVEKIITLLTERGYTYEKDGALWCASSKFGCEKDDVLVRDNGIPTYFAADIAYHYHKFCVRNFDWVIDIWGADHHGHVQRLKGALEALGISPDRLTVILMQMVRLIKDGQPVKVSKRTGKSITLATLLEEIPTDAACFFFNLREPNSHFDVDLDLAISKTSDNPVYYVQYAHARICSILKKLSSGEEIEKPSSYLPLCKEEKELVRKLALFPNEILESSRQLNSSRITLFAVELASVFHKFYNACPVKGDNPQLTQARLRICLATKLVLENLCSILDVTAPETM